MKIRLDIFNPKQTMSRIFDNDVGIFTAEICARNFNKFVPMQTGMLSQNYATAPFKITYNQPYANRMYKGSNFNFSKEQHPLATDHWDKEGFEANKRKIANEITAYLKR